MALAYPSALTMLLVALVFLGMVKSFAAPEWLYAATAALAASTAMAQPASTYSIRTVQPDVTQTLPAGGTLSFPAVWPTKMES